MKRIIPIVLALVAVLGLAMPVCAEVPDLNRPRSLRLIFYWSQEPVEGGEVTLYRVGDIVEDDGNYSFAPIAALKNANISFAEPNDPVLIGKLVSLAEKLDLPKLIVKIEKGEAVMDTLSDGLYLVYQSEAQACKGFDPIAPFVISLPRWVDGHYVYDVEASPKIPLKPEPTETTAPTSNSTSPNKKLPQTGQLWWPVPVLMCMGLGCIIIGLIRRREEQDEA